MTPLASSSLPTMGLQAATVAGLTQADSVIPVVRRNDAASRTVTQLEEPSNDRALPYLPFAQRVLLPVPVLFRPEESLTLVPAPSFMP